MRGEEKNRRMRGEEKSEEQRMRGEEKSEEQKDERRGEEELRTGG